MLSGIADQQVHVDVFDGLTVSFVFAVHAAATSGLPYIEPVCVPATVPSACSAPPPGSTPPAPVARCPHPPHQTSAADAGPAPGGHTGGSGPPRSQSGAPPCAVRSLPGIGFRGAPTPRPLRSADNARVWDAQTLHRRAGGWGGRRVGRRRDWLSGLGAWGSVSVLRENAARLVACSPAAPLPVPDAAARSSDSSARFPASVAGSPSAAVRSAAGLGRVLAWTNSTTSGCSLRSSRLHHPACPRPSTARDSVQPL